MGATDSKIKPQQSHFRSHSADDSRRKNQKSKRAQGGNTINLMADHIGAISLEGVLKGARALEPMNYQLVCHQETAASLLQISEAYEKFYKDQEATYELMRGDQSARSSGSDDPLESARGVQMQLRLFQVIFAQKKDNYVSLKDNKLAVKNWKEPSEHGVSFRSLNLDNIPEPFKKSIQKVLDYNEWALEIHEKAVKEQQERQRLAELAKEARRKRLDQKKSVQATQPEHPDPQDAAQDGTAEELEPTSRMVQVNQRMRLVSTDEVSDAVMSRNQTVRQVVREEADLHIEEGQSLMTSKSGVGGASSQTNTIQVQLVPLNRRVNRQEDADVIAEEDLRQTRGGTDGLPFQPGIYEHPGEAPTNDREPGGHLTRANSPAYQSSNGGGNALVPGCTGETKLHTSRNYADSFNRYRSHGSAGQSTDLNQEEQKRNEAGSKPRSLSRSYIRHESEMARSASLQLGSEQVNGQSTEDKQGSVIVDKDYEIKQDILGETKKPKLMKALNKQEPFLKGSSITQTDWQGAEQLIQEEEDQSLQRQESIDKRVEDYRPDEDYSPTAGALAKRRFSEQRPPNIRVQATEKKIVENEDHSESFVDELMSGVPDKAPIRKFPTNQAVLNDKQPYFDQLANESMRTSPLCDDQELKKAGPSKKKPYKEAKSSQVVYMTPLITSESKSTLIVPNKVKGNSRGAQMWQLLGQLQVPSPALQVSPAAAKNKKAKDRRDRKQISTPSQNKKQKSFLHKMRSFQEDDRAPSAQQLFDEESAERFKYMLNIIMEKRRERDRGMEKLDGVTHFLDQKQKLQKQYRSMKNIDFGSTPKSAVKQSSLVQPGAEHSTGSLANSQQHDYHKNVLIHGKLNKMSGSNGANRKRLGSAKHRRKDNSRLLDSPNGAMPTQQDQPVSKQQSNSGKRITENQLDDASNLSRSVEKMGDHDLTYPFNIPRGDQSHHSKTPTQRPKARAASDKSISEEASKGSSKVREEKISSHQNEETESSKAFGSKLPVGRSEILKKHRSRSQQVLPEDEYLKDVTQSGGSSAGQLAKTQRTSPRTPELKQQPTEDVVIVSEEADKASAPVPTREAAAVVPVVASHSLSQMSEGDDKCTTENDEDIAEQSSSSESGTARKKGGPAIAVRPDTECSSSSSQDSQDIRRKTLVKNILPVGQLSGDSESENFLGDLAVTHGVNALPHLLPKDNSGQKTPDPSVNEDGIFPSPGLRSQPLNAAQINSSGGLISVNDIAKADQSGSHLSSQQHNAVINQPMRTPKGIRAYVSRSIGANFSNQSGERSSPIGSEPISAPGPCGSITASNFELDGFTSLSMRPNVDGSCLDQSRAASQLTYFINSDGLVGTGALIQRSASQSVAKIKERKSGKKERAGAGDNEDVDNLANKDYRSISEPMTNELKEARILSMEIARAAVNGNCPHPQAQAFIKLKDIELTDKDQRTCSPGSRAQSVEKSKFGKHKDHTAGSVSSCSCRNSKRSKKATKIKDRKILSGSELNQFQCNTPANGALTAKLIAVPPALNGSRSSRHICRKHQNRLKGTASQGQESSAIDISAKKLSRRAQGQTGSGRASARRQQKSRESPSSMSPKTSPADTSASIQKEADFRRGLQKIHDTVCNVLDPARFSRSVTPEVVHIAPASVRNSDPSTGKRSREQATSGKMKGVETMPSDQALVTEASLPVEFKIIDQSKKSQEIVRNEQLDSALKNVEMQSAVLADTDLPMEQLSCSSQDPPHTEYLGANEQRKKRIHFLHQEDKRAMLGGKAGHTDEEQLRMASNASGSDQTKVRRMFSIKTILEDINENELSSQAQSVHQQSSHQRSEFSRYRAIAKNNSKKINVLTKQCHQGKLLKPVAESVHCERIDIETGQVSVKSPPQLNDSSYGKDSTNHLLLGISGGAHEAARVSQENQLMQIPAPRSFVRQKTQQHKKSQGPGQTPLIQSTRKVKEDGSQFQQTPSLMPDDLYSDVDPIFSKGSDYSESDSFRDSDDTKTRPKKPGITQIKNNDAKREYMGSSECAKSMMSNNAGALTPSEPDSGACRGMGSSAANEKEQSRVISSQKQSVTDDATAKKLSSGLTSEKSVPSPPVLSRKAQTPQNEVQTGSPPQPTKIKLMPRKSCKRVFEAQSPIKEEDLGADAEAQKIDYKAAAGSKTVPPPSVTVSPQPARTPEPERVINTKPAVLSSSKLSFLRVAPDHRESLGGNLIQQVKEANKMLLQSSKLASAGHNRSHTDVELHQQALQILPKIFEEVKRNQLASMISGKLINKRPRFQFVKEVKEPSSRNKKKLMQLSSKPEKPPLVAPNTTTVVSQSIDLQSDQIDKLFNQFFRPNAEKSSAKPSFVISSKHMQQNQNKQSPNKFEKSTVSHSPGGHQLINLQNDVKNSTKNSRMTSKQEAAATPSAGMQQDLNDRVLSQSVDEEQRIEDVGTYGDEQFGNSYDDSSSCSCSCDSSCSCNIDPENYDQYEVVEVKSNHDSMIMDGSQLLEEYEETDSNKTHSHKRVESINQPSSPSKSVAMSKIATDKDHAKDAIIVGGGYNSSTNDKVESENILQRNKEMISQRFAKDSKDLSMIRFPSSPQRDRHPQTPGVHKSQPHVLNSSQRKRLQVLPQRPSKRKTAAPEVMMSAQHKLLKMQDQSRQASSTRKKVDDSSSLPQHHRVLKLQHDEGLTPKSEQPVMQSFLQERKKKSQQGTTDEQKEIQLVERKAYPRGPGNQSLCEKDSSYDEVAGILRNMENTSLSVSKNFTNSQGGTPFNKSLNINHKGTGVVPATPANDFVAQGEGYVLRSAHGSVTQKLHQQRRSAMNQENTSSGSVDNFGKMCDRFNQRLVDEPPAENDAHLESHHVPYTAVNSSDQRATPQRSPQRSENVDYQEDDEAQMRPVRRRNKLDKANTSEEVQLVIAEKPKAIQKKPANNVLVNRQGSMGTHNSSEVNGFANSKVSDYGFDPAGGNSPSATKGVKEIKSQQSRESKKIVRSGTQQPVFNNYQLKMQETEESKKTTDQALLAKDDKRIINPAKVLHKMPTGELGSGTMQPLDHALKVEQQRSVLDSVTPSSAPRDPQQAVAAFGMANKMTGSGLDLLSPYSQSKRGRPRARFTHHHTVHEKRSGSQFVLMQSPSSQGSGVNGTGADGSEPEQSVKSSSIALLSQYTMETKSVVKQKKGGRKQINNYIILGQVGQGNFAKVKRVVERYTKQVYAMKVINKAKLKRRVLGPKSTQFSQIEKEVAIMKKMAHPHIVKLVEVIDDPQHHKQYLIQEFVPNGDLLTKIRKVGDKVCTGKGLTEQDVRKYFRQLLAALWYCHEVVQIFHRDIKPDNLMLDADDNLKLTDFGVSHSFQGPSSLRTHGKKEAQKLQGNAGSAYYFAPEACSEQDYNGADADIWACAVTLYYMVFGRLPFQGQSQLSLLGLYGLIRGSEPSFERANVTLVGDCADFDNLVALLKRMLKKDPTQRPSLQELQSDPWLTEGGRQQCNWKDDFEYLRLIDEPTEDEVNKAFSAIEQIKNVRFQKK